MEESKIKHKRYIFVCVNTKESGECCSSKESAEIAASLKDYVKENSLSDTFTVRKSLCLSHCSEGPTVAIFPEGKILTHVSKDDMPKIIEKYLTKK